MDSRIQFIHFISFIHISLCIWNGVHMRWAWAEPHMFSLHITSRFHCENTLLLLPSPSLRYTRCTVVSADRPMRFFEYAQASRSYAAPIASHGNLLNFRRFIFLSPSLCPSPILYGRPYIINWSELLFVSIELFSSNFGCASSIRCSLQLKSINNSKFFVFFFFYF